MKEKETFSEWLSTFTAKAIVWGALVPGDPLAGDVVFNLYRLGAGDC